MSSALVVIKERDSRPEMCLGPWWWCFSRVNRGGGRGREGGKEEGEAKVLVVPVCMHHIPIISN